MPTCHIALVEDDASVSRAIERLLRASGLATQTYASAEEFLASAAPESCPCLILDIQLPGMSGFELLDHLQSLAPTRPAIFITAEEDESVRNAIGRFPDSVLMRKPIVGTALLNAVREQLCRRDLPSEPAS